MNTSVSKNAASRQKNENFQKANKYCIAALVALSLALAVLSAGTFLLGPTSLVGIISTCAGVICTLLCILFFALYSHYLQQTENT